MHNGYANRMINAPCRNSPRPSSGHWAIRPTFREHGTVDNLSASIRNSPVQQLKFSPVMHSNLYMYYRFTKILLYEMLIIYLSYLPKYIISFNSLLCSIARLTNSRSRDRDNKRGQISRAACDSTKANILESGRY